MINRVTFLRSKSDDIIALVYIISKITSKFFSMAFKALYYLVLASYRLFSFFLQTLFQKFWTFCSLPKICFLTLYPYTYLEHPSLLFLQLSFYLSLKTRLNHKFLCKIFLGILHFTSQPTQAICQLIFPLCFLKKKALKKQYILKKKCVEVKFT